TGATSSGARTFRSVAVSAKGGAPPVPACRRQARHGAAPREAASPARFSGKQAKGKKMAGRVGLPEGQGEEAQAEGMRGACGWPPMAGPPSLPGLAAGGAPSPRSRAKTVAARPLCSE
ncbi:unnamed protein product, partial [Amoebophrya sp. A120]